jgi:hypothetical protein
VARQRFTEQIALVSQASLPGQEVQLFFHFYPFRNGGQPHAGGQGQDAPGNRVPHISAAPPEQRTTCPVSSVQANKM